MNLALDPTQTELVEMVREVVETTIKPYTTQNRFPADQPFDWYLIDVLREHNLVCPTIPKQYGGLGLDYFTTALLVEELALGCTSLAGIVDTNLHAVEPILLAGTPKQKEQYLPLLTGKQAGVAAVALTEASSGSDLNSMSTIAKKVDQGFVVNGSKDYIINSPQAEFISLFAATEPGNQKLSMRAFLVPKSTPGVLIKNERVMSGLDYIRVAETVFDNAFLDQDHVMKEKESCSGYLLISETFDIGRAMIGAASVGVARAAYEEALSFAETRVVSGKPIKQHQSVAFALTDMAMKIEAARLITWKACWLIDQRGDYTVPSAMAKIFASSVAQEVTCAAADIMAAQGHERGSLMDRLVRDARILSTVEGTNNILRKNISSLL